MGWNRIEKEPRLVGDIIGVYGNVEALPWWSSYFSEGHKGALLALSQSIRHFVTS